MSDKKVEDMTIKELTEEIDYLRNKYVWGLQVEDIVDALNPREYLKPEDVDITMNRKELIHAIREQLIIESFDIYDWYETAIDVSTGFSDETNDLIALFVNNCYTD